MLFKRIKKNNRLVQNYKKKRIIGKICERKKEKNNVSRLLWLDAQYIIHVDGSSCKYAKVTAK